MPDYKECPNCGGNMEQVTEAATNDTEVVWKCEECGNKEEVGSED